MELGFIGLGRMGANMVRRLLKHGHTVVVWNRTYEKAERMAQEGAIPTKTLQELAQKLSPPRVAWIMVPQGKPVDQVLAGLVPHLEPGDIVIDGGNSHYTDSQRRARELAEKGIRFLDVGVSGGVWGLEYGYGIMIGGPEDAFRYAEPVFQALAPAEGYAHLGPSGAGHFVKMVHNGIEYGMLQAIGEGFAVMQAKTEFNLDLKKIAHIWQHGTVIRCWLLELLERAFEQEPGLEDIVGYVEDSGEGRWTLLEALDLDVPVPVIAESLFARFYSRLDDSFAARVVAALRNQFGGHRVRRRSEKA